MVGDIHIRSRLKKFAAWVGVEIQKKREVLRFLEAYNFRSVLDIGANSGQFAKTIRRFAPEARIHSFEPLPEPFSELVAGMRRDGNFIAYPLALGSAEEMTIIHANEFSPSSSLLPMSALHVETFPQSGKSVDANIRVTTLDQWASNIILQQPLLIKMDVQGFEGHVIAGGRETIRRAGLVLTEVSFKTLYEGQPLFDDIYVELRRLGFNCDGMVGNLYDPISGCILQADAVFSKLSTSEKPRAIRLTSD